MTEKGTLVRKGMPSPRLAETEFKRRFISQFRDQAFTAIADSIDKIADAAWDAYLHSRKSPRTRRAGPGYADPDYALADDWLAAHDAIGIAQGQHEDAGGPIRILLINGSARSEHTCPGEMSKSFRLAELAREVVAAEGASSPCSTCRESRRNMAAISIRARHVFRRRRRSVIGHAPAIQITRSDRPRTG